jgi:hypothetical protein
MEDRECWVKSEGGGRLWRKKLTTCRSSRYQHDWLTAPREFRSTRKSLIYRALFSRYHCPENCKIGHLWKLYPLQMDMPVMLVTYLSVL